MNFLIIFLVFVFGAMVGSFLNVVILRFGAKKWGNSRSVCLSCSKRLLPRDLIPIVSFFILKGRCRFCKAKLSWQYPLVELATAFLFTASFIYASRALFFWLFIAQWMVLSAIFSALIAIFVYDLKHKIIPDKFVLFFAGLSAVWLVLVNIGFGTVGRNFWPDILAGLFSAAPFFFIWLFSKGRWMGLGDAKLALPLGWLLGYRLWLSALVSAFWLGALWVLIAYLIRFFTKHFHSKKSLISPEFGMKTEVPFAPFLIISALIGFFFDFNVFQAIFSVFL